VVELEGARGEDEAKGVLDRAVVVVEIRSEEVEELGVRGFAAEAAEVVGGGDDAAAEDVVPEAVDDDAGGERIVMAGDAVGEFEAAAMLSLVRCWVDGIEEVAGNGVGGLFVVPADEKRVVRGVSLDDAGGAEGWEEF
jgi:hypothetical protein